MERKIWTIKHNKRSFGHRNLVMSILRNKIDDQSLTSSTHLWSVILSRIIEKPVSFLELGCNIGINLHALSLLNYKNLTGLEINQKAAQILRSWGGAEVFETSILDFISLQYRTWDLVFTSGVLIHINPDELPKVYSTM